MEIENTKNPAKR